MDKPIVQDSLRNKSSVFLDDLTDLPNRYFLYNLFTKFTSEAKAQGTKLCFFMLDVDGFKRVNDTCGHLRGDKVIKEVALILRECVRTNDIVIRYAGDEFTILSRISDEAEIRHICNRITERISKNIFKGKSGGDPDLRLTMSGGFSIYPRDGEDLEELLDHADKALYFSKERGKNRFSDYNEVSLEAKSYKEVLKALSFPSFVDRVSQISKLKELYSDTLSSYVNLALIKGRMGTGKSRLLDEFQNFATLQGAVTLKAVCASQHIQQPYHALCAAIDDYLKKAPDAGEVTSVLSEEEIKALQGLIPSFGTRELNTEDSRIQRINIFKGLRDILAKLSLAEKGLLLYFDNLQWLDQATLELLNYFLLAESRHKIMCVAALCYEDIENKDLPCNSFVSNPKGKFVSLELEPLQMQEAKEFIAATMPHVNAPDEFFESVYKITRGNCLFTQEVIKCLVEDGKILYKDNQWQISDSKNLDIPYSLEEVIQRRFKKIDPEIKETLAKAAIMGESSQLEILRKIVKKDQGQLFEIIDQAKEKGLLSPESKIGEVNFLNDYVRKAIYKDISTEEKADLHRKAEEAIKNVYGDNLMRFAGDLAYHSQEMGDTVKAAEYKKSLLKNAQDLFNHAEITNYLEQLSQEASGVTDKAFSEVEIAKVETEVSEEVLSKTLDLIRAVLTAVKNISLYPAANKMRQQSIRAAFDIIRQILSRTPSFTLSELNRLLLVNSKRLPHRNDKDQAIEYFISLMVETDTKAIQFLSQIEEAETSRFFEAIALEPDELRKRGGLAAVLTQEKVIHIKIGVTDYGHLTTSQTGSPLKMKERLTSTMLLDFLLSRTKDGNIDSTLLINQLKNSPANLAKDLIEAAKSLAVQKGFNQSDSQNQARLIAESIQELGSKVLPGGWRAYAEDLAKLFSHLDKPLQTDLISMAVNSSRKEMDNMQEVMSSFSVNEIVEIISSGYNKSKDSLLYMKDLADKLAVFQPFRKEKVVPLLENKLKEMGLSETEVSFVTRKEFKDLSLYDKKEILFKLPARFYAAIGRDNIQDFIAELISTGNIESLDQVIKHILDELAQNESENKEILYQLLGDFIGLVTASSTKFDDIIFSIFSVFQKRLEEEDAKSCQILMKDIELAVEWVVQSLNAYASTDRWVMHKRLTFLNDFIHQLCKKMDEETEDKEALRQQQIIREFMARFAQSDLIESLVRQLKDTSLYSMLEEIILKFGPLSVDKLIAAVSEDADFSFESYMYRKKISGILKKIGKPAIQRIKDLAGIENDTVRLRLLIEIIGYLKDPDLVESLYSLSRHQNVQIRMDVAEVLSKFGNEKSNEILSEMSKDKDISVAQFVKSRLGGKLKSWPLKRN